MAADVPERPALAGLSGLRPVADEALQGSGTRPNGEPPLRLSELLLLAFLWMIFGFMLWYYLAAFHGAPTRIAADAILEMHAAGPAWFAARNRNALGGDIAGGSMAGLQALRRPALAAGPVLHEAQDAAREVAHAQHLSGRRPGRYFQLQALSRGICSGLTENRYCSACQVQSFTDWSGQLT